jgi:hypothetical protein
VRRQPLNLFLQAELLLLQIGDFEVIGRRAALRLLDLVREELMLLPEFLQMRTQGHVVLLFRLRAVSAAQKLSRVTQD